MKDIDYAGVEADAVALSDRLKCGDAGADGYARIEATEALWTGLCKGCAAGWQDLSALWFDDGRMHMALSESNARKRAIISLAVSGGAYPSVGLHHKPAMRLERAMRDLYGTSPVGLPDDRPWLDHGVWPGREGRTEKSSYGFLPVEGVGLHQIPVGPVHAGIIEPGHFRFTANGETVARLEERLGYVHKGVEALCAGAPIDQAAKVVARISGDSTVAYSFAFARAVESALGWEIPVRARLLRGIMAELERLANHVGDVGAICNDASVIAIQARCTLIREDILQTNALCFGHRLMMDRILPGGTACDADAECPAAILALLERIETQFRGVERAYDQSPSLQNRTVGTGIVQPEFVREFAAGGYVGRAAGRSFDARTAFPYPPYEDVSYETPARQTSDVDARVWIRIEEIGQSLSIIRQLVAKLEAGPVLVPPPPKAAGVGAALVEAFRGDLFVSVRLDEEGRVAHLHARDASWFQWPLLEAAIKDNIVADFPLCNKSFNCSYSGHDL
jgi:Ni,Fe-hydrogenase III large subunit